MGHEWGLVLWGSPYWNEKASPNHGMRRTQGAESFTFKTNSFESMKWLAPRAMIVMTFKDCNQVEFWPPHAKKQRRGYAPEATPGPTRMSRRQLIVDEMYSRGYAPEQSGGSGLLVQEGNATLAAMLVPSWARQHISYKDDKIDLGLTMYKVLQALRDNQAAVEIGGATFSLSNEMRLAREEFEEAINQQRLFQNQLEATLRQLG